MPWSTTTRHVSRGEHMSRNFKLSRKRNFILSFVLLATCYVALKLFNMPSEFDDRLRDFKRDWCRIRRMRVDWEQMLKPCEGKTAWREKQIEPALVTDAENSFVSLWDIRPAGEFSRFSIQSQTAAGQLKTIGGDSWRVHVNGPVSVAGTVFDLMNGTYEVVFLLTVPGEYQVDVMLDHSLCTGFTDPPPHWFGIGNAQGKNQKEGVLGTERPYLLKPLWAATPIWISVPRALPPGPLHEGDVMNHVIPATNSQYVWTFTRNKTLNAVIQKSPEMFDASCGIRCNFLWDGFGAWVHTERGWKWKPLLSRDDKPSPGIVGQRPVRPDSVLWVYGDSVSEQFYSGIRPHPLCTGVFKWCGHTYNWVYQLRGNVSAAKSTNNDLDFDYMRVAAEVGDVINRPIFDSNSVLLLNAGLHYLESTNFTNYQNTIDAVIRLIQGAQEASGLRSFPGHLIWKTSTAVNKQKLDGKHMTSRRFLTFQRVLLFNAYATAAMCRAGFEVLDVHPMTDSYPHGTGTPSRPKDAVHYEHFVFESVERLLVDHFIKTTIP